MASARLAASAVESMARQPEVAGNVQTAMIIAAALIEGATFFALIVCMLFNTSRLTRSKRRRYEPGSSLCCVRGDCLRIAVVVRAPGKARTSRARSSTPKRSWPRPAHDRSRATSTSGTDPLSVDPDLAIWTLVVFVVLLVVLRKFAWGPISRRSRGASRASPTTSPQAERNHEEAKRLLARVRAEAGRRRRRGARADGRGPPRRRACQAGDPGRSQGGRRGRAGPGAARDRGGHRSGAREAWPSAARNWPSSWPARSCSRKLSPADHARLIQEAMAKFPAAASVN